MALIDLKSNLTWYGTTPPHGLYQDSRENTKFKYNDDLTVTAAVTGNAGQNLSPRTSRDEFDIANGSAKRKTQLGQGTIFPIGPAGQVHTFDSKRIGWHVNSKYGGVYNKNSESGLAKTYTETSPIDDQYNKFKVRDEVYDPFGYAKPPFILRGIQQDDRTDPQRWGIGNIPTMDVPRDGIVSTAEHIAADAARLGKFLIRPNGLLFIGKQLLLHAMQPNLENDIGINSVVDPQKLFNPVNLLASALGSPVGLRFKNWGLLPTVSTSVTYETTKKVQDIVLKGTAPVVKISGLGVNRLINLAVEREGNYFNPLGDIEWLTLSALTGPDSVGGIGRTSFSKLSNHDTYKALSVPTVSFPSLGNEFTMMHTEMPYARKQAKLGIVNSERDYGTGAHQIFTLYDVKKFEENELPRWGLSIEGELPFVTKTNLDKHKRRRLIDIIGATAGSKRKLPSNYKETVESDYYPLTSLRSQLDFLDIQADKDLSWSGQYLGRKNLTSFPFKSYYKDLSLEAPGPYLGTRETDSKTDYIKGQYINNDNWKDSYTDPTKYLKSFFIDKRGYNDQNSQYASIAYNQAQTVAEEVTDADGKTKVKNEFAGGVDKTTEKIIETNVDNDTKNKPTTIIDYRARIYPQIRKTTKDRQSGDGKLLDFRNVKDDAIAEWDTQTKPTLESFYGYTPYTAAGRKKPKPDPIQNAVYGTSIDTLTQKDLIKFEFEGIGSGKKGHGKRFMFRAYINSLDDQFSPGWSGQQDQGRADQKYLYASYERTINVDFKVVVHSHAELRNVWDKLSELASITLPTYPGGGFHGQFIRVTIGDLYVRQYMFISSLSYSWDNETPWEITDGMQLPMYTDVSLSLTHVGIKRPEVGLRPYDYNANTKLSGPFGDPKTYDGSSDVSDAPLRDTADSPTYDAAENKATVVKETVDEVPETDPANTPD